MYGVGRSVGVWCREEWVYGVGRSVGIWCREQCGCMV